LADLIYGGKAVTLQISSGVPNSVSFSFLFCLLQLLLQRLFFAFVLEYSGFQVWFKLNR